MRAATRRAALALALIGCVGGPAAAGEPVNVLAKHVPADCLVFVAFDGKNAAYKQTALYDVLTEPEVKAAVGPPLAALKKLLGSELRKVGGPDLETVLLPLVRTRIGVAFMGLAPAAAERMAMQPELLVVAEVGGRESPQSKAVARLIPDLLKQAGLPANTFQPQKIGAFAGMAGTVKGTTISYVTTRGHFLLGTGDALVKALDANSAKLADAKAFRRVSRLTGGNEIFLAHYAHGVMMQKMGLFMPPEVSRLLVNRELGLANIQSLSVALAADGKGFKGTVFLHAPGEQKGLLEVLRGKPLDPAIIRLAPKGAEYFYATSLDVGKLWDWVMKLAPTPESRREVERDIAQANREVGFDIRQDLVGSLGNEFALFGPPFAVVIRLKDPAKFKRCANALLKRLAKAAEDEDNDFRGARLALKTMQYGGRTLTYVDGRRLPMFIQPCYVMAGDYAVFALYPTTLKTYVTQTPGRPTLADKADFAAVRAKLGRGLSSLYYADSKAFVDSLYEVVPFAVGLCKMVPAEYQELVPDPARLPPAYVVNRHLFGCAAGRRAVPDGVLWEWYSPVGLPTPPAIRQSGWLSMMTLASVALPMIMFARMAGEMHAVEEEMVPEPPDPEPEPAVRNPQQEAQRAKSSAQLKVIGHAAHLWVHRKGNNLVFPPTLKALLDDRIIADPKLFINPATGTQLAAGRFVSDYDCVLDRVGGKVKAADVPGDTLPLAWDRREAHPGGRNVVFFDAHVEFVDADRFDELMDTVDEWVAKQRRP